jgi:hypothetical protein
MNAHIMIVFLIAYFAKVSGLLEFSWLEFLTPFCVIVAIAVVANAVKQTALKLTVEKLDQVEKQLADARVEWKEPPSSPHGSRSSWPASR